MNERSWRTGAMVERRQAKYSEKNLFQFPLFLPKDWPGIEPVTSR